MPSSGDEVECADLRAAIEAVMAWVKRAEGLMYWVA